MKFSRGMLPAFLASVMTAVVTMAWLGAGSHSRAQAQAQSFPGLRAQIEELQRTVNRLSLNDPPVGTVMAFAGEWDLAREQEVGWMLCDGRKVKESEYLELFAAVRPDEKRYSYNRTERTFTLPNFQGVFLRGIDKAGTQDPEGSKRIVGQFQDQSLAKHRHHVKLTGGAHDHNRLLIDLARYDRGGDTDNDPNGARPQRVDYTPTGGGHEHDGHTDTDGGSDETRPKNCAVYWIIKFRSGAQAIH